MIRALVLDDDIRHEYGKAHEHASIIAKGALNVLTGLMPSKWYLILCVCIENVTYAKKFLIDTIYYA